MLVPIRTLLATLAFCAVAHSPSNGAEAHLDARELRELIVGNTVHGENLKRMPFNSSSIRAEHSTRNSLECC